MSLKLSKITFLKEQSISSYNLQHLNGQYIEFHHELNEHIVRTADVANSVTSVCAHKYDTTQIIHSYTHF